MLSRHTERKLNHLLNYHFLDDEDQRLLDVFRLQLGCYFFLVPAEVKLLQLDLMMGGLINGLDEELCFARPVKMGEGGVGNVEGKGVYVLMGG